jgi:protein-S-isoprenylcysteine O-methyltransferase Ste14
MNQRTASLVATAVLIAAIVALALRRALFADRPVAITVQIAAVLLMLWARRTFGARSFHAAANPTEGGIVTTGPYRYLRHPIYAAVLYFVWAGVLTHASALNAALGAVATAATAVRIWAEESLLIQRYPDYPAYAARTKRLVPYVL